MAEESDMMEKQGDQLTFHEGSGEENDTFEEASGGANDGISSNKRLLGCSINNITTSPALASTNDSHCRQCCTN
jgi:hypothetical protein